MKIYFFNSFENFDYTDFMDELPDERRKKCESYKNLEDKQLCAAAYLLLRAALRQEFGTKTVPEIETGASGKPYFKGKTDLFFNLSHCPKGVVCAVSEEEIGVDIQDAREVSEKVASRVLNAEELAFLNNSADKNRAFAYLWSRKECAAKRSGAGIACDLKKIDTLNTEIQTHDGGDYFISVSPAEKIEIINIPNLKGFDN